MHRWVRVARGPPSASLRLSARLRPAGSTWACAPTCLGETALPIAICSGQLRRGFGTAAFTVPERDGAPEQILFVVGLNTRKFFGEDGAEEGLKLLERVADHTGEYHLLFGLEDRDLKEIEEDYKVKHRKLTPSRELERARNCEVIPIVQAGQVDQRPRRAIDRSLRITQSHVAWQLWNHPREAVKLYWAVFQRHKFTDAEKFKFWMHHFPIAADAYFEERAEHMAIRTVEHMIVERVQGRKSTTVLTVNNEVFQALTERLKMILDGDAPDRLGTPEFAKALRERGAELCRPVPDLTSLLVFVYAGLPMLLMQQGIMFVDYLCNVPRDGELAYDLEHSRD